MMKIDIVTIFPEMFEGPLGCSMIGRARENQCLNIDIHNLRDYTHDRHNTVDDSPYGGGCGMVMKPEPFFECLASIDESEKRRVVMMCPQGRRFTQDYACELAAEEHIVFICGHYEGIDERVRMSLVDDEISIGDYVLTGGELPAMVVIDALARHIPGVLGKIESIEEESFSSGLLEYPQYTRPPQFDGMDVPSVLLSGNHELIRKWRLQQSLLRTAQKRPDLLKGRIFTKEEKKLIAQLVEENPDLKFGIPSNR